MKFDDAFEKLLGHEGGYTAGIGDPGGETKFGISKRSYPMEDIPNLTLDRAKAIYLHDFWGPAGCDAVPEALRFDLFDMAVNSGVSRAVRTLQGAVGETQDGVLGPRTLLAASTANPDKLLRRFNGARLHYMTGLPTWNTFGRGWAERIAQNLSQ